LKTTRKITSKKEDSQLADSYMREVKNHFDHSKGLQYLFMDAHYAVLDKELKETSGSDAFKKAMEDLWKNINQNPDLSTDEVKQVESKYKKLQNATKEKEEQMRKMLEVLTGTDVEKIEKDWSKHNHYPQLSEVQMAAKLAAGGVLKSVKYMTLRYLDLKQINADHLAMLASIVEEKIVIDFAGMTRFSSSYGECDLSPILKNIKCPQLWLGYVTLSTTDTELLVQALEQRLKTLDIGDYVTLDLETLLKYSGKGACRKVVLRSGGFYSGNVWYNSKLDDYAREKGWSEYGDFTITRP